MKALRITVKGQVQGLGFRPYVHRLATRLNLDGTVANTRQGVTIHIQGRKTNEFLKALKAAPPRLARIASIKVSACKARNISGFRIVSSKQGGNNGAGALDILPDIALCADCRREITAEKNRRYRYALTNCTQCGPRYSIMLGIPYDRERTTMRSFKMCLACQQEYDDPEDRRFHAQPNCCPVCGPKVVLLHPNGNIFDENDPIATATRLLQDGKIIAIKGIGGFHIACDATNEAAVAELRRRKDRPAKPLAVMCRNLATVRMLCPIDRPIAELLEHPARPIVLVPKPKAAARRKPALRLAENVAPGINCWGIMLPYTPLQHLLFQATDSEPIPALVMTSANLRDEPIIATEQELSDKLQRVVDYILTHNREISNRCDDSILFLISPIKHRARQVPPLFIRRSKGYAPSPIVLNPRHFDLKPVFAAGGEQKNTFALAAGNRICLSPHIGDLDSAAGMEFYTATLETFRRFYNIRPEIIACDLHPDYLSTRFAENWSQKSHRKLIRVQHHHAHIASVIAEHDLKEPVLGIALDGTGLGTDDRIWGCELLLCSRRNFQRLGHLRYLPLIGGEAIIMQPEKIAASYLVYLLGEAAFAALPGMEAHRNLLAQLNLDMNVVFTSSTGRLFDAASAILGVCRQASYDGQAPAMLESIADDRETGHWFEPHDLHTDTTGQLIINPQRWLSKLVDGVRGQIPAPILSRQFHNTFITALVRACRQLVPQHRPKAICLSGGSFQNRLLLAGLLENLTVTRLPVMTNNAVPVNDGGLAFGQAIVAAS